MYEFLVIFALLLVNAFFAMSEMAIVSASKTAPAPDGKKERTAETALKLAEDPGPASSPPFRSASRSSASSRGLWWCDHRRQARAHSSMKSRGLRPMGRGRGWHRRFLHHLSLGGGRRTYPQAAGAEKFRSDRHVRFPADAAALAHRRADRHAVSKAPRRSSCACSA